MMNNNKLYMQWRPLSFDLNGTKQGYNRKDFISSKLAVAFSALFWIAFYYTQVWNAVFITSDVGISYLNKGLIKGIKV
jgi:hypothetical protein